MHTKSRVFTGFLAVPCTTHNCIRILRIGPIQRGISLVHSWALQVLCRHSSSCATLHWEFPDQSYLYGWLYPSSSCRDFSPTPKHQWMSAQWRGTFRTLHNSWAFNAKELFLVFEFGRFIGHLIDSTGCLWPVEHPENSTCSHIHPEIEDIFLTVTGAMDLLSHKGNCLSWSSCPCSTSNSVDVILKMIVRTTFYKWSLGMQKTTCYMT